MTARSITITALVLATYNAGCAATPSPVSQAPADVPAIPSVAPAPDTALIRALLRATQPDEPLQVLFDWSLQDRDVRVQGKGIVRMQGPYRARLDLFAGQDIQVLRSTLIDDKLDLVYNGPAVPLPPVAFLWSVLGVFREPDGAAAPDMTRERDGFTLSYQIAGSHWRFRADSTTLRSAEWRGSGDSRRTVELSGPFRMGRPTKASYRDWREFRELVLTVTSVEKVEPFAPDTWNVSNR